MTKQDALNGLQKAKEDRIFRHKEMIKTCKICGSTANSDIWNKKYVCKNCDTPSIVQAEIPYACKLLFQELQSIYISARIMT